MKKIIIFLSVITMFSVVMVNADSLTKDQILQICNEQADYAEAIMEARQRGVSRETLYEAVENDRNLMVLINDAFEYSVYGTDEVKETITDYFSEETFQICLEALEY